MSGKVRYQFDVTFPTAVFPGYCYGGIKPVFCDWENHKMTLRFRDWRPGKIPEKLEVCKKEIGKGLLKMLVSTYPKCPHCGETIMNFGLLHGPMEVIEEHRFYGLTIADVREEREDDYIDSTYVLNYEIDWEFVDVKTSSFFSRLDKSELPPSQSK